ncbi:MAG: type IV pilus biogenesis protein PilM [Aquificaceae bacterium]
MKLSLKLPSLKLPSVKKPTFKLPFGKISKTVLGMQMTDKVIRMVELGRDKKPLWEPVEVMIEGKSKEEILVEIVKKNGLSGKSVSLCLPAKDGLIKLYKYPATVSRKDLYEAVNWSIKREKASIKEELYHDYFILEPTGENKQFTVILALTRKETVESIKNLLSRVGLNLYILDYEVISLVNYGLYHQLPVPFSILYIDYDYSILTTYSVNNITYQEIMWNLLGYLKKENEESFEHFVLEIRNITILNDITSLYIAGPGLAYENAIMKLMENIPVLGLLDLENLKPQFFIPYILSIRGMEG